MGQPDDTVTQRPPIFARHLALTLGIATACAHACHHYP